MTIESEWRSVPISLVWREEPALSVVPEGEGSGGSPNDETPHLGDLVDGGRQRLVSVVCHVAHAVTSRAARMASHTFPPVFTIPGGILRPRHSGHRRW